MNSATKRLVGEGASEALNPVEAILNPKTLKP